MGKIKTFRGQIADSNQERIYLAGGESDTGYKIVKIMLMPKQPGVTSAENVVKVFSKKQAIADISGEIDLRDDSILAVAVYESEPSSYSDYKYVIIDDKVINQDIYITNDDARGGAEAVNFYLELEEVKMSNGEQAVVNFDAALIHGE